MPDQSGASEMLSFSIIIFFCFRTSVFSDFVSSTFWKFLKFWFFFVFVVNSVMILISKKVQKGNMGCHGLVKVKYYFEIGGRNKHPSHFNIFFSKIKNNFCFRRIWWFQRKCSNYVQKPEICNKILEYCHLKHRNYF